MKSRRELLSTAILLSPFYPAFSLAQETPAVPPVNHIVQKKETQLWP